jgi:hypothetical protein
MILSNISCTHFSFSFIEEVHLTTSLRERKICYIIIGGKSQVFQYLVSTFLAGDVILQAEFVSWQNMGKMRYQIKPSQKENNELLTIHNYGYAKKDPNLIIIVTSRIL